MTLIFYRELIPNWKDKLALMRVSSALLEQRILQMEASLGAHAPGVMMDCTLLPGVLHPAFSALRDHLQHKHQEDYFNV
jgi:hypothetical protein